MKKVSFWSPKSKTHTVLVRSKKKRDPYKDMKRAISKMVDIKIQLEKLIMPDYVGDNVDKVFKLLDKYENACRKAGFEEFRAKFKK